MAEQTSTKWYSNGLTEKKARKLIRKYAKIEKPIFGLIDRDHPALQFKLSYEDSGGTSWYLSDQEDIKQLFDRTGTNETSQLAGKVVEAFVDDCMLKGLSVNKNLI